MPEPRCWQVWRADVGERWTLDTKGAARTEDRACLRAWTWQRLGVRACVVASGIDPNEHAPMRAPIETEHVAGLIDGPTTREGLN